MIFLYFDKHKNNIVVLLTLDESKKIIVFANFGQVKKIVFANFGQVKKIIFLLTLSKSLE